MASLFTNLVRAFSFATRHPLIKTEPLSVIKQQINPGTANLRKLYYKLPWMESPDSSHQVDVTNWDKEKERLANDVVTMINDEINSQRVGRLFAVVHLCGKQFKITENDVIIVQGHWPPNSGDHLKLEKILLVGGTNFTLVGRPILNRELVTINATIIEKTLSHTKTRFRMQKRKQYRRINFYRTQFTALRINDITINSLIHRKKDIEGLDRIY